jgi:hypothetical protein
MCLGNQHEIDLGEYNIILSSSAFKKKKKLLGRIILTVHKNIHIIRYYELTTIFIH